MRVRQVSVLVLLVRVAGCDASLCGERKLCDYILNFVRIGDRKIWRRLLSGLGSLNPLARQTLSCHVARLDALLTGG